jgi:hypothetical protein
MLYFIFEMSYGVNLFEILVCEVFFLIDKKYLIFQITC